MFQDMKMNVGQTFIEPQGMIFGWICQIKVDELDVSVVMTV